jgi:hypothetical protein
LNTLKYRRYLIIILVLILVTVLLLLALREFVRWRQAQPEIISLPQLSHHVLAVPKVQPHDLSPLTFLGNPALIRYPTCQDEFARNPWSLMAFNGQLYIGLGDDDANAGPVPVYRFSPENQVFFEETILPDEKLDRFYIFNDELFIPGDDPQQSWALGNIYNLHKNQGWQKLRTLPKTIHTHALAQFDGLLFAGVLNQDAAPANLHKDRYGSAVAISNDLGLTWKVQLLAGWRIFDFLMVNGKLYATDIFSGPGMHKWLKERQRADLHSAVYEYENSGQFKRRPDLDGANMFPETKLANNRAAVIERSAQFIQSSIYVAAFSQNQDNLPTRVAYVATQLESDQVKVERLALPRDAIVWDLFVDEQGIWVLFSQLLPNGNWLNQVWRSVDAKNWVSVAEFENLTFARSFAKIDQTLYFGMGSLNDKIITSCQQNHDTKKPGQKVGDILRFNLS